MRRLALAAAVSVLALVLGVPGWSETSRVPAPDSRDAYRPKGWSGGEHIIRVQRCGKDHVLVWLDTTHILASANVRMRDASGSPRETLVMLVASDAGMTAELPDNAWWRAAVGMKKEAAPPPPPRPFDQLSEWEKEGWTVRPPPRERP